MGVCLLPGADCPFYSEVVVVRLMISE